MLSPHCPLPRDPMTVGRRTSSNTSNACRPNVVEQRAVLRGMSHTAACLGRAMQKATAHGGRPRPRSAFLVNCQRSKNHGRTWMLPPLIGTWAVGVPNW
jgi:hypothetical protein